MTIDEIKAVNKVIYALKNDPDYYDSWKANIATAFQDEFYSVCPDADRQQIWRISNDAAERFLKLLLY